MNQDTSQLKNPYDCNTKIFYPYQSIYLPTNIVHPVLPNPNVYMQYSSQIPCNQPYKPIYSDYDSQFNYNRDLAKLNPPFSNNPVAMYPRMQSSSSFNANPRVPSLQPYNSSIIWPQGRNPNFSYMNPPVNCPYTIPSNYAKYYNKYLQPSTVMQQIKITNQQYFPDYIPSSPSFIKKRYIMENITSLDITTFKNAIRRSSESFIVNDKFSATISSGPRRAHCKEVGAVSLFCNGKEENLRIVSVAESSELCEEYIHWIKKKIRFRNERNSFNKVINIIGLIEVCDESVEVDMINFYNLIKLAFPHWKIIYEPLITNLIVIIRQNDNINDHIQCPDNYPNYNVQNNSNTSLAENVQGDSQNSENIIINNLPNSNDQHCKPQSSLHNDYASPLEVICTWMIHQELNEKELQNNSIDYHNVVSSWLDCVIIVSNRFVIIHKTNKNIHLENAWKNFFPLIRHFIVKTSKNMMSNNLTFPSDTFVF